MSSCLYCITTLDYDQFNSYIDVIYPDLDVNALNTTYVFERKVQSWDRDNSVAALNRLMGSQNIALDSRNSKNNRYT